jgi:hypothetical protein
MADTAPHTRPSLLLRLQNVAESEAWHEFVRLYTPLVFRHCTRHGLQEASIDWAAEKALPEFQPAT